MASDPPGAVRFVALPQGRLVSVQRVRGAVSDRTIMISVGAVEQERLDATSECPDGCRGIASSDRLFETCGTAEQKAGDAISVLVLGPISRSFPEDRSVRGGL